MPTIRLNIRLLKPGWQPNHALKGKADSLHEKQWPHVANGRLFYGTAFESVPAWRPALEQEVGPLGNLASEGSVALLFLPIDGRFFVISWGMAHIFLENSAFVHDFGLKVVLNTVDRKTLRSCDIRTPEEITTTRRVQTSRTSDVDSFDIDPERDILRGVTGTPTVPGLGNQVTGSDNLIIRPELTLDNIHDKLKEIKEFYESDSYKHTGFDFVDYIKGVRDEGLVADLDHKLVNALDTAKTAGIPDHMHLAPPDVVDWEQFGHVKYTGFRSQNHFSRLDIEDLVNELARLNPALDVESVTKRFRVQHANPGSENFYNWHKLYECIIWETLHNNIRYIISGGIWYQVEQNFANAVENFFSNVSAGPNLPSASAGDNEKTYNAKFSGWHPEYACLDGTTTRGDGFRSGIEPFDFLTDDRKFLHIKHEATSSKLSHLFNQGLVSIESFLGDAGFRRDLKRQIGEVNPDLADVIQDPEDTPDIEDFEIVFAVIRSPDRVGNFDLPFFSKVALRNVARRLNVLRASWSFSWIAKPK